MIRYLATLAAVARHGTFAAAGDRPGLTPSAVSIQMRRLEETLGVALFDRDGRTAVPNEAGRRAVQHAEQILLLYGQMAQGVADGDVTGTLRAGAISTEMLGPVVDALVLFRERFPDVEVHLTPGASVDLVALVETRRLDCAVILRPAYPLEGALHWKPLRREAFVLIAPPSERSQDVTWLPANYPLIRYDRHSHGGSARRALLQTSEIPGAGVDRDRFGRGCRAAGDPGPEGGDPAAPSDAAGGRLQPVELGVDTFYREIGMFERADNPRAHLNGGFWRALAAEGDIPAYE